MLRLLLNNHDPNEHGFSVDKSTFEYLRSKWRNRGYRTRRSNSWKKLQNKIPEEIDFDVHGSKAYFEWLKGLDIKVKDKSLFFTDLVMMLPFSIAEIMEKIYYKFEINPTVSSYNRDYASSLKNQKRENSK